MSPKSPLATENVLMSKEKELSLLETPARTKYILNVLFVPVIKQSLLSVGQMLENNYSLFCKNMSCTIVDPSGCELMSIKMRDKIFQVEWKKNLTHAVEK